MTNMKKTMKILLVMVLTVFTLSLGAGCSGETGKPSAEEEYSIKIISEGEQVTSLNLTKLQSLPTVSLSAFGKSEEGPTLLSVLKLAGINEFSKVTVIGMVRGRIATGELTLTRSEITDEVILDFTNRGTTKLAGAQIPEDNWIIDVTEIRLE
jgi:hypothetical protein